MALAERAGQGSWQYLHSVLSAMFPAVCGGAWRALKTCCPHRPEGPSRSPERFRSPCTSRPAAIGLRLPGQGCAGAGPAGQLAKEARTGVGAEGL